MKRRLFVFGAVGILLMALIITGCEANPGSGEGSAASSAFMAISEAVTATSDPTVTETSRNSFEVKEFRADDGTVISGTFTIDESGTITAAELTMRVKGTGQELSFVLKQDQGKTEAAIGNEPISPSDIKKAMTREQSFAFRAFIEGLEEALDAVNDRLLDSLEDIFEDRHPGEYEIDNAFMKGTITVGREEWDDDDTEIVSADIQGFTIPLWGSGEISGSYSFKGRGDNETADISMSIKGFSEEDDGLWISLDQVTVDARIEEGERRDDDYFIFDGSIEGAYRIGNDKHEISFSGKMEGDDDDHFHFSDYSLRINGDEVAVGTQYRNHRR